MLPPGTRIGPYEVHALLGRGGMGEVYRARDTTLDRDVALKILPESSVGDPERLALLQREAKTLAALNHPNIAHIYGVEQSGSSQALVIELVEGEDLAQRITRGRVPFGEALRIGRQVAEALEAAHHAGVIHRDLKPANIRVRADGTVKVLDFGIAKRVTTQSEIGDAQTHVTLGAGTAGTPEYMAPELLRGGVADARSDIFSLGVVLFMLVTGQHPFKRASVFETAEAILSPSAPHWPSATPVPAALKRVIATAIAKDSAQRWATAREVGAALSVIDEGDPEKGSQIVFDKRWLAPAAMVAVTTLLFGTMWRWSSTPRESIDSVAEAKHSQVTFVGNVRGIALSPDGRTAAYGSTGAGTDRLMVRDIAGGQALEIWRGELITELQWTRDGSSVVVSGILNDKLGVWIVPRLGGGGRALPIRGAHIAVSPASDQLAFAMQNTKGFGVAPIAGGSPRTVTLEGFQWLLGLDWGSSSNRLAVLTQAEDGSNTIWTVAPDGTEKRLLYSDRSLSSIRWSPVAPVIYAIRSRDEAAEVIRLRDDGAGAKAEVILTGLPWDPSDPYQRQSSLSTDGRRLLYARGFAYANLWRIGIDTKTIVPLTEGTSRYWPPRISPDGKWIVSALGSSTRSSIVKLPIDGGEPTQLTSNQLQNIGPSWSRDGREIAYLTHRENTAGIAIVDSELQSAADLKHISLEPDGVVEWMPDGRLLSLAPGGENYLLIDPRAGSQSLLFRAAKGWPSTARVSADGLSVAVWLNVHRGAEQDGLWVITLPGREERLVRAGNDYPAGWSKDGRSIYAYDYLGKTFVRVSVDKGETELIGSFPVGAIEGCDVAPDEKSALCALRETKSDAWIVDDFDHRLPK